MINACLQLAQQIALALGINPEPLKCQQFADGEIDIHIQRNVRGTCNLWIALSLIFTLNPGADVFVIQPTCPPDVNKNLMELLLLIHTLRLSSPR